MSRHIKQNKQDSDDSRAVLYSTNTPDLESQLVRLAKDSAVIDQAQEDDAKLAEVRALATELGAPYRDAKKANRLKIKQIVDVLSERGATNES